MPDACFKFFCSIAGIFFFFFCPNESILGFLKKIFFFLFIYFWLHSVFVLCCCSRPFSSCEAQDSHCGGFFHCAAWSLRAYGLSSCGERA